MTKQWFAVGVYAGMYSLTESGETLYVVQEFAHEVSEVFEDRDKAMQYFEHTERYEAAQQRKGRR